MLDNWRVVYAYLEAAVTAWKANDGNGDFEFVIGYETGNIIQLFLYNITQPIIEERE